MAPKTTKHVRMRSQRSNPAVTSVETDLPPIVVDLCCGLGGLSLAAQQLGLRTALGLDPSSTAIRTFKRNFPSAQAIQQSVRSTRAIDACKAHVQSHRGARCIVVSGPPCQGFSVAGPRNAADPRNRILCDVARAILRLMPHCALIENVSTVLNEKHSDRLTTLKTILSKGGYSVCSISADAVNFGVPQKRRRAFILVTAEPVDEDLIASSLEELRQPVSTVEDALHGLPTPQVRPDKYHDTLEVGPIYNHFAMRHSKQVIAKIAAISPGKGPMSYRRLHPSRPSNTLISGHRAPPSHFAEPRSITVREAARLQGFPDSFRVYGTFSNQMNQVTNAVPPPLARAVLRVLLNVSGVLDR